MDRLAHPLVLRHQKSHVLSVFTSLMISGCAMSVLPEGEQAAITAQTKFEQEVKPGLLMSCANCHSQMLGQLPAFLAPGSEYSSVSKYKGGFFLTRPPELSYLLNRGIHEGPALDTELARAVYDWLVLEVRTGQQRPLVTPMLPIGPGDFYLSLESLVKDPQAKITFSVEALTHTPQAYVISQLKLSAGSVSGVYVRHPRFVLSSPLGVDTDKGDSLSSAEQTVPAGETQPLGIGGGVLVDVPVHAQLALVFEQIESRNIQPMRKGVCKAPDRFSQTIVPPLKSSCALSCHAGSNANATNVFDMTAAQGVDTAQLARFCVQVLARVDLVNPAQSILVRQVTNPPAGTANHPFKFPDPKGFRDAVSAWAMSERM